MSRRRIARVHAVTALVGFALILTFWLSTVVVELFGSADAVTTVKQAIPWGLLVLTPCVLYLGAVADQHPFDTRFQVVQAIELIAGATNLVLMGANIRDGLRLSGRLRVSR